MTTSMTVTYTICVCLLPILSQSFSIVLQPRCFRDFAVLHASRVDINEASKKLLWEILEERMARPVLNLSNRQEDFLENRPVPPQVETLDWDQGQRWAETRLGLLALEIPFPDELLAKCPQLYRLESAQVLETTKWLLQQEGFGVKYVTGEPRALSYKLSDVEYGYEFLQQMTMSSSLVLLVPLLLSGIEGGLQERTVQEALGSAADATYNANQRIAGDAAATLKSLKHKGPPLNL